ncbi:MAG: hypothetical protein HY908_04895, partial [Myxococcales bacterium]|nr:hypothetical protein [Myxococcales bacterium]
GPIDCRKMAVDWPSDASPLFSRTPLYVAEDGTATLMFRRISDRWVTDMVADVDGAVRMAMMRVRGSNETSGVTGCATSDPGYRWPRYALGVRGADSEGTDLTTHQGLITGSVESGEPEVFRHYTDGLVRSWFISESLVAWEDATTFQVYASPWSDSESLVTAPPTDPDNLHANQVRWWKDALFWKTNAATIHGINIWTANEGARPFIRWVGDPNRGAADLGTDGVDLVWAYGEGAVPPTSYAARSIMTAPYTTDSATVHATARRLRSDPDECIGCDFFEVGCGYAAHRAAPSVMVVRLSDGWSWRVPSVWPDAWPEWALGVTCDEVFVYGRMDGAYNIARIRLDSLGPGEAPD